MTFQVGILEHSCRDPGSDPTSVELFLEFRYTAQHYCKPQSKKLTKLQEVIAGHILGLDSRGFAPTLVTVRNMADKLLAERGAGQVGQK